MTENVTTQKPANEEQRQVITYKDQQYFVDELSDSSQRLVEHLFDIERDVYLKQLEIEKNALAKEYIIALLEKALSESESE